MHWKSGQEEVLITSSVGNVGRFYFCSGYFIDSSRLRKRDVLMTETQICLD